MKAITYSSHYSYFPSLDEEHAQSLGSLQPDDINSANISTASQSSQADKDNLQDGWRKSLFED